MKIAIAIYLLLFTMQAIANYQQDIPVLSTSEASANSDANSAANSSIASDVSLNQRYEEVSASAATLMIPGCNDGQSAQVEGGGIGLSQRSPNCVYVDDINAAIALANFYRVQAKLCPDDPAQQKHLHDLAHMAIDDAEYYQGLLKDYAADRHKTGWVSAWFKDLVLPTTFGGWLVYVVFFG